MKALREEVGVPIHFHTHDTSGINAASLLRPPMRESISSMARWRR